MAAEPTWSDEQLQVIEAAPDARLLVEAGPGTGKTAVACARVAHLVDSEDVTASRVLLVSFTRTAVAELRERIIGGAVDKDAARSVKISTIDAHAWRFRVGFEAEETRAFGGKLTFESNIDGAIKLLKGKDPDALRELGRLRHVIIDEAQDVVGKRAELLFSILSVLDDRCGITVFTDPAQAIYGFTKDAAPGREDDSPLELCSILRDRALTPHTYNLSKIYRTESRDVVRLFSKTRAELERNSDNSYSSYEDLRNSIEQHATAVHSDVFTNLDGLKGRDDTIVLYRWRAEAVRASDILTQKEVPHRLRLSGLPVVVHPWIAILLSSARTPRVGRSEFDLAFDENRNHHLLLGWDADNCWSILNRQCGVPNAEALDLLTLREQINRSRPPLEICQPDLGDRGPIIGTIHAAKGREADVVRLMLPRLKESTDPEKAANFDWNEERRVLYVGATRPRASLVVSSGYSMWSKYLNDRRIGFTNRRGNFQIHIGLAGDVDPRTVLQPARATEIQRILSTCANGSVSVEAIANRDRDYVYELRLEFGGATTYIGDLSDVVNRDLWSAARQLKRPRPPLKLAHLRLFGVTTAAIPPGDESGAPEPFRTSGLFLSPIIRGLPVAFYRDAKKKTGKKRGKRRSRPRRA
ncbi:MAG: AAA family ATPase [Deltaproteobacteria bacterium]